MSVPRYKATSWPPLFAMGFRPFFLGAAAWSAVAMAAWLLLLWRGSTWPTAMAPVTWHAHEMLFGFVAAAVAGFLLTAIPNWTGRMPLQGARLAALVALWLLGRAAVAFSGLVGAVPAALLDLSFLGALLAVVLREVVAGRNWRNLPVAVALALLLIANGMTHGAAFGYVELEAIGLRLAVAVMVMLISLIGGRIIPSFTGNWLRRAGETRLPAPFGAYDRTVLGLSAVALAGWVVAPEAHFVAVVLVVAGILQGMRLMRWGGARTAPEPLLWVLHLGYGWVGAGLVLLGVGAMRPELGQSAALHALTAGAMGTMILAVMSRATLGHSGRPLTADAVTVTAYLLVSLAAVLRVVSGVSGTFVFELQIAAGIAWICAFALFLVRYAPLHLGVGAPNASGA